MDDTETTTATTSADAAPPPQVWPTLSARDARGLIRFLVEAFGFEQTVVYGDGDQVHHAELAWPAGGGIMLGSAGRAAEAAAADDAEARADGDAAEAEVWPRRPGTFSAYAVTDDPDALYARAKAAGARIKRELTDTDYGSREFVAADPEGNHWSFGTYRGAPRRS